jgi:hypothetical protein
MRRVTTLTSLLVLGAVAVGCGAEGPDTAVDAVTVAPESAALGSTADDRVDDLEAELAEVRDRVDDLESRTAALEAELGEDVGEGPDEPTASEPARPRTAEGLIDQLRVYLRDLDALPDGFEPGVTNWTEFEVPEEVQDVYDTPGEVMAQLAAVEDAPQLGTDVWETTIRVLLDEDDPDLAYGAMLSWGFLDDSVEGRDVRITLTRTDDDRWEPGGAEQRFQCIRGVTDDGELCL